MHLSGGLAKKVGPFPLGVWLGIGAVGTGLGLYYRRSVAASSATDTTTATDTTATDPNAALDSTGGDPYGDSAGGYGDPSAAGSSDGYEGGTIPIAVTVTTTNGKATNGHKPTGETKTGATGKVTKTYSTYQINRLEKTLAKRGEKGLTGWQKSVRKTLQADHKAVRAGKATSAQRKQVATANADYGKAKRAAAPAKPKKPTPRPAPKKPTPARKPTHK